MNIHECDQYVHLGYYYVEINFWAKYYSKIFMLLISIESTEWNLFDVSHTNWFRESFATLLLVQQNHTGCSIEWSVWQMHSHTLTNLILWLSEWCIAVQTISRNVPHGSVCSLTWTKNSVRFGLASWLKVRSPYWWSPTMIFDDCSLLIARTCESELHMTSWRSSSCYMDGVEVSSNTYIFGELEKIQIDSYWNHSMINDRLWKIVELKSWLLEKFNVKKKLKTQHNLYRFVFNWWCTFMDFN